MKHHQSNDSWTLVFQKGEPFMATLIDFCRKQQIKAGFFHGLGGVLRVELGYYHLDRQEYEFHELDRVLEIASLHGNVALKDGEPFIHAHGVFSDTDLRTYGGHVKEMITGGTIELQLTAFTDEWQRLPEPNTGLSLIDFNEPAE